jgi:hypothetical protein
MLEKEIKEAAEAGAKEAAKKLKKLGSGLSLLEKLGSGLSLLHSSCYAF